MKILFSIVALLGVLYLGFLFYFDFRIDSPDYRVLQTLAPKVEIREYDEYFQAYVSYENLDYESQAFRKLFNFISGENSIKNDLDMTAPVKLDMTAPVKLDMTAPVKLDMTAPVKLDMTAPVKLDMTAPVKLDMTAPVKLDMTAPVKLDMTAPVKESEVQGMAFVMPRNFDPSIVPNDSNVKIQKVESQKIAVIRYSGLMSESKMQKKYLELVAILDQNSIAYEKGAIFAGYNGPYTIPFLRKNEVWIQIK